MAFCSNCGQKLAEEARFCFSCGTSVKELHKNEKEQRRTVYEGDVHKCPNCGEVLNSFVAICPACRFEFREAKISESIKEFINLVDESEKKIPQFRTGIFERVGVALNASPKLSAEEKKLVSLIENFPFPNDRESILAAFVYTKEKVAFISQRRIDRRSVHWLKLWRTKAEQLKQRADILFPNDTVIQQSYTEILDAEEKVKKYLKKNKVVVGLGAMAMACAITLCLLVAVFWGGKLLSYAGFDGGVSLGFDWSNSELGDRIPHITVRDGKIITDNSGELYLRLDTGKNSRFESYVELCQKMGYNLDEMKSTNKFLAYNSEGYRIEVYNEYHPGWTNAAGYQDEDHYLRIRIAEPSLQMSEIKWASTGINLPRPNSDVGKIMSKSSKEFVAYVANFTEDDYREYIDLCLEVTAHSDYLFEDNLFVSSRGVIVEYLGNDTMRIQVGDSSSDVDSLANWLLRSK